MDYIRNILNPGILGCSLHLGFSVGIHNLSQRVPQEASTEGSSDDGAAFAGETGGFWKDMGFARNATFALVFVFSIMAFTRNTGTNVFPMILGLFLEIGGTSSRILNTLSNAGACVSITTIERLKKILIVSLAEAANKLCLPVVQIETQPQSLASTDFDVFKRLLQYFYAEQTVRRWIFALPGGV
ncbi:hypothetical protein B0H14DRAFT_3476492 [Mycena olivaceomarginata]|nr:hypothetical protein B0H14DRAFT_3476492 [Mycena olivaceomarginata]